MKALRWAIAGAAVGGLLSALGGLAIFSYAKLQREWRETWEVVG